MSLEEEKVLLERIRAILRESDGLTDYEVAAVAGGPGRDLCRRLLTLLIGQGFATVTYEQHGTDKNGRSIPRTVYRTTEKPS